MTPDQNAATAARPTSTKWYWISGTLALIVVAGIAGIGATTGSDSAVEKECATGISARKSSYGTEWINSRSKGWTLANGLTEDGC